MKRKLSIIFCTVVLTFSFQNLISQNQEKELNSYAIWINKYEKGWIDSENSYWLFEINSDSIDSNIKSAELSYLCRPTDFEAESCCTDNSYVKDQKTPNYSGEIWETRDFFDNNNAFKLKLNSITIRIVSLRQENCKCSYEYIHCQDPDKKVASIFNYKILELAKKEKKAFRKNKSNLLKFISN